MESLKSIIVSVGENREIGKGGDLLWHIPQDLKRFREITTGHPVIMGRTTYQSIGRPLPRRTNVVITRDQSFSAEGCIVAHNIDEALQLASDAQGSEELFIIGGAQIYEQALPLTDKLYLTLVHGSFPDADTFFPSFTHFFNRITFGQSGEDGGYRFRYLYLERSDEDKNQTGR